MLDIITTFTERLQADWLPSFCRAPHRDYPSDGFKPSSIRKLNEYDAIWFMEAVDSGLISESDGFFMAPKSKAKEQIFWEGTKKITPRSITLWIEPIITIGALGRLNKKHGWPVENLGAQSKTWAFDLVCYESNSEQEFVVCEVKKDTREIERLLKFMKMHCSRDPEKVEPANAVERNAYRKVQGIRRSWPKLFWALGPNGKGHVFHIQREGDSQRFHLIPTSEKSLIYKHN